MVNQWIDGRKKLQQWQPKKHCDWKLFESTGLSVDPTWVTVLQLYRSDCLNLLYNNFYEFWQKQ